MSSISEPLDPDEETLIWSAWVFLPELSLLVSSLSHKQKFYSYSQNTDIYTEHRNLVMQIMMSSEPLLMVLTR